MQFCPNCDSIMVPEKVNKKTIMICRKCNTTQDLEDASAYSFETEISNKKDTIVELEETSKSLPTTKEICSKCGNKEAYWWMYQTRSGDEPATKFLRCTKCSHTWRDYH